MKLLRTTMGLQLTLRLLTGAVACCLGAGCSEYGGGASVEPTVTFVAAEGTVDSASGDSSSGTAAVAATAAPGAVSGRVVLTGAAPALSLSVRAGADIKDKAVCAAIDLPDERLLLGDGNGVANVFVYLQRAPKGGKSLEPGSAPIMFDQKNCRFIPHCVLTPVGHEVRVLSDDAVAHNTHTNPKKQTGISQVVPAGDRVGDAVKFAYKKAEATPLSVTCDFHGWMGAWHLPLDHPYAALTNEKGEFVISDLPAGKHVFMVWHEAADGGFVERKLTVDVKSGETAQVEVSYPVEKLKL